ncbi:unnamed protein product [Boreogadus saida]
MSSQKTSREPREEQKTRGEPEVEQAGAGGVTTPEPDPDPSGSEGRRRCHYRRGLCVSRISVPETENWVQLTAAEAQKPSGS